MTLEEDLLNDLQQTGPLVEFAADVGFLQELRRPHPNVSQQQIHSQYHPQASQQLFTHQQHPNYQQQPQWHDLQHPTHPSSATAPPIASSPRTLPQHHSQHRQTNQHATSQQSFPTQSDQDGLLINTQADISAAQAQNFVQASRYRLQQAMLAPMAGPASDFSAGPSRGMAQRRKTTRPMEVPPRGGRTGGKGLRHFSMKVCEKVESKGHTTYNEVADELVLEKKRGDPGFEGVQDDEKNIRRRVYDAINVLMALGIIGKDKKEITWKGFPSLASTAMDRLRGERALHMAEVERKHEYLQGLVNQQRALRMLLERGAAAKNGVSVSEPSGTPMHIPFILIQAKENAMVEVTISEDMREVLFDFYHSPFQVRDDSFVLQRMVLAAQQMQVQATQQKQAAQSQNLPPQQQTPQSAQHQHNHGAANHQQQQQQVHPASQAPSTSHGGHVQQQQQNISSQQQIASSRGLGNGGSHAHEPTATGNAQHGTSAAAAAATAAHTLPPIPELLGLRSSTLEQQLAAASKVFSNGAFPILPGYQPNGAAGHFFGHQQGPYPPSAALGV